VSDILERQLEIWRSMTVRRRKMLLIFLALPACLLVIGGIVADSVRNKCSDELVRVPGSMSVVCGVEGRRQTVTYEVDEPLPATRTLGLIRAEMRKRNWTPLREDFVNPGMRSSHLTGWRSFEEDGNLVRQWLAQWSAPDGRIAWYELLYSSPRGDSKRPSRLKVNAALIDKHEATAARDEAQKRLGTRGEELSSLAIPCGLSPASLRKADSSVCRGAEGKPAPTRLGDTYNLSLLPGAVARVTGAPPEAARTINDGWYGACGSLALVTSPEGTVNLDLGGAYQLTGVALTAETESPRQIAILAGSSATEMLQVASYDGILAGKRLFSFPAVPARFIRVTFMGGKAESPVRLEEVEAYGECF
jgi:hypothetical protein